MAERVVIGDAELWHGDCREIATEVTTDAVITDPPYGIASGGVVDRPTKWRRLRGELPEQWDSETCGTLPALIARAGVQCVWGGNYYELKPSRGWLCWWKPDAPPSMASIELAWSNRDQNARHFIWSIGQTNAERTGHASQKPLAVMRWCLGEMGLPMSVFDPFMGSGTTGVACMQLGRKFIGIEIERRWFDIACKRIDEAQRQGRLALEAGA